MPCTEGSSVTLLNTHSPEDCQAVFEKAGGFVKKTTTTTIERAPSTGTRSSNGSSSGSSTTTSSYVTSSNGTSSSVRRGAQWLVEGVTVSHYQADPVNLEEVSEERDWQAPMFIFIHFITVHFISKLYIQMYFPHTYASYLISSHLDDHQHRHRYKVDAMFSESIRSGTTFTTAVVLGTVFSEALSSSARDSRVLAIMLVLRTICQQRGLTMHCVAENKEDQVVEWGWGGSWCVVRGWCMVGWQCFLDMCGYGVWLFCDKALRLPEPPFANGPSTISTSRTAHEYNHPCQPKTPHTPLSHHHCR